MYLTRFLVITSIVSIHELDLEDFSFYFHLVLQNKL